MERVNWIRGWLRRPDPSPPREPSTAPAHAEPIAAPPVAHPDPWRPLASEFALRLLTLTWEAVHYVGQAEEAEPDPERRHLLFRIDHAVTRTRRLAENLRVLTGESVEDPDQQVTTLQDVTRAAGAPAEHYDRLHFGPIADLAVAAVAADDVIRILTELIDNADRYSPPTEPVNVSAHLTGEGDVLVRVEDSGIGLNPAQVPWFNHVLAGAGDDLQPAHVGLPVVAVLTRRHQSLRVRLSPRRPRGTVAMLLIGADLVSEIPRATSPAQPAPPAQILPPRQVIAPPPRPAIPAQQQGASYPIAGRPPAPPARPAPPPMPRRVPASVRGTDFAPAATEPVSPVAPHTTAWPDDAAAFNSGVDAARAHLTSPN
jgi:Histidine kinase-, DNA gyrase B-, and HSP90-like ATPase